jgi:ABC-2 type transport system ATP-binding protein
MTALIEAHALTKTFGDKHAVKGVSLHVNRGEVLGFLGPNGAGKSTTMRMLTGFLEPTSGTAHVGGINVWQQSEKAKALVGYLPEGAPLYPDMTPHQLLRFVGEVRHMPRAKLNERYALVVASLGLSDVLSQAIDTLSKGFKRRVGLAQAILHDPDILILDEPTDGLDPLQKREVRGLIHSMAKDKAIIISTHILEEVDAVCTRAVMITQGSIVSDGTPAALRKQYGKESLEEIFCDVASAGGIN